VPAGTIGRAGNGGPTHLLVLMKTYFAKLLPPRPSFVMDMTDAERQLMQAHAQYWRGMLDQGRAVTFGLVLDPRGAFGIGVLELPDDADVNALTNGDPTIAANVGFRYEVSLMPMGAVHR